MHNSLKTESWHGLWTQFVACNVFKTYFYLFLDNLQHGNYIMVIFTPFFPLQLSTLIIVFFSSAFFPSVDTTHVVSMPGIGDLSAQP